MCCGNTKEDAVAGKADHWRERLCVIDALALTAALSDKSCLVPLNSSKGVCFSLVNPHAFHYTASSRQGNEVPCVVRCQ
jgi:hypothetical protein